jgi:hypothetical protein
MAARCRRKLNKTTNLKLIFFNLQFSTNWETKSKSLIKDQILSRGFTIKTKTNNFCSICNLEKKSGRLVYFNFSIL